MAKSLKLAVIALFLICLASCGKKLIYFQEKENSKNKYNSIEVAKPENPRDHLISAGDILGLKFNSSNSELSNEFKDKVPTEGAKTNASGYIVNENGTLFFPFLGSLPISGKTIKEAEDFIKKELEKHILEPQLELSLISFRITVLGDVSAPGIKNSPGDRMTIIDALSLAGDLSENAKRSNIKVIRKVGDKKTTYFLDITSVDIFLSEAYYLKSNDLVYVEPLPRKFFIQNISYVSAIITVINALLIITRF